MENNSFELDLFYKHKGKVLKTIHNEEIILTNLKIDHRVQKIFFVVKYVIDNNYGYLDKNTILFN